MAPWQRWTTALLALLVVGVGCVTVSGGDVDQSVSTYVFEPTLPSARAGSHPDGVLLVSPPEAAPGYDSRFMVYSEHPFELSRYAYSQWADSPAVMLEPLLITSLQAGGHFGAVVDISSGVLADLRLDTEIVTIRQEFEDSSSSRARIVLRARIVELRSRSVLATRTFEAAHPAATRDARGGVAATNVALTQLLGEVTDWAGQSADTFTRSRPE